MSFEEAKKLARRGVKMKHISFLPGDYMLMSGDIMIFSDGDKIHYKKWFAITYDADEGWEKY